MTIIGYTIMGAPVYDPMEVIAQPDPVVQPIVDPILSFPLPVMAPGGDDTSSPVSDPVTLPPYSTVPILFTEPTLRAGGDPGIIDPTQIPIAESTMDSATTEEDTSSADETADDPSSDPIVPVTTAPVIVYASAPHPSAGAARQSNLLLLGLLVAGIVLISRSDK